MQKTIYVLLAFSLLFSVAPLPSSVLANEATEAPAQMDVYSDSEGKEVLQTISSEMEFTLLKSGTEFSKISFLDSESNESIVGYLSNLNIHSLSTRENTETTIPSLPKDEKTETQQKASSISSLKKATLAPATATIKGVALKSPTNIYETNNTSSNVLKSYAQGTLLTYSESSYSNFYQATVYVNGVAMTGYIYKNDVELPVSNPQNIKGVAIKNPTVIYAKASPESKGIKTYAQGSNLTYKPYINGWYQATVYINSKAVTGYIDAKDVTVPTTSPIAQKGIGLAAPTAVYAKASETAKILKKYAQGSILSSETYIPGWSKATVTINGKKNIGYIKEADLQPLLAERGEGGKGIGLVQPTAIYTKAAESSKVLKTYAQGTVLQYKTLSEDWNEATVYVNGKATTGYLKTKDLEDAWSSSQILKGFALKSPTNIYSKAAVNSKVLKTYKMRTVLSYRELSANWFECTVTINGKKVTGYIHANDVKGVSYYELSIDQAVAMQMKVNPQTDSSGSWKTATAVQTEYYLNPTNFLQTTSSFYQFLDLSSVAGTNASELNSTVLKNKGILSGQASSFISAAKTYGINEIYLISHALLETGHGNSALANGIVVSSIDGKAVTPKKVYNMYGIGAIDKCPEQCGSEYAYKAGWFTPEAAVIGGAQFIGNGYINAGQNTLYKMRWNPEKMVANGYATHQYASDIGWAVKQTVQIANMYSQLSKYNLTLEIPNYLNNN